ncbi:ribose transport system permease protein/inositol transport system permease protein [Ochrobactrum sp. J50]|uniref:Ribose/xylose/arabinose/galactoside ABC-type transport system permease subunit n=2 Tax=Brucella intermedia TaxID=94625 RepID=A0ABR6AV94_9HYPH|nr:MULTISPECIES: ABC transporter permease [Brucella/Ochrobactrum group]MBA8853393.1 ribose/xylose/arabinose/galactoside ABC-type transport system permease subunit [Brucella intermedia]MPR64488.1 ABC transporter permease [Brucella intermedia]TWH01524.1 ribose transport system permease protein/inositol transport system permease protein [Ochrobactrum sp. J50]
MQFVRKLARYREASVLLMLITVAIYLAIASDYFLSPRNLLNVGRQASVVAIVALGQALVIIARGIDLSVGSVIGLSAVVAAITIRDTGYESVGLAAGLLTGVTCGVINGVLYTRFKINPFIATLGVLSIGRGLALLMTGGIPVPIGGLAEFVGAGRLLGIPVSFLLMIVLAIIVHVFVTYTVIGREIYAIGDNPKAARLAGVNIKATRLVVFTICGLLAGLGGLILSGNLASADPNLGIGYELDVIAAVILGGTALSGGRGSIIGVVIGALLMALLNNAFVLLGVAAYWQVVTKGLVIILAVGIDGLTRGNEDE